MTRKEFHLLPHRERRDKEIICDSIVIIPSDDLSELHDSGFRRMAFVPCAKGEPICRVGGFSDVLNLKEKRFGNFWSVANQPREIAVIWNIDCLPKSGYLQLWCDGYKIVVGPDLSNMELYLKEITDGKSG